MFTTSLPWFVAFSKISELEEELKVVGNNMKALEISEQEVTTVSVCSVRSLCGSSIKSIKLNTVFFFISTFSMMIVINDINYLFCQFGQRNKVCR